MQGRALVAEMVALRRDAAAKAASLAEAQERFTELRMEIAAIKVRSTLGVYIAADMDALVMARCYLRCQYQFEIVWDRRRSASLLLRGGGVKDFG